MILVVVAQEPAGARLEHGALGGALARHLEQALHQRELVVHGAALLQQAVAQQRERDHDAHRHQVRRQVDGHQRQQRHRPHEQAPVQVGAVRLQAAQLLRLPLHAQLERFDGSARVQLRRDARRARRVRRQRAVPVQQEHRAHRAQQRHRSAFYFFFFYFSTRTHTRARAKKNTHTHTLLP